LPYNISLIVWQTLNVENYRTATLHSFSCVFIKVKTPISIHIAQQKLYLLAQLIIIIYKLYLMPDVSIHLQE